MAFCVFEFAVGVFWPSMMKMRSQHVPEEMRATVINLFRIPLNAFVCVVLYNVRTPPFVTCSRETRLAISVPINSLSQWTCRRTELRRASECGD